MTKLKNTLLAAASALLVASSAHAMIVEGFIYRDQECGEGSISCFIATDDTHFIVEIDVPAPDSTDKPTKRLDIGHGPVDIMIRKNGHIVQCVLGVGNYYICGNSQRGWEVGTGRPLP